VEGHLGPQWAQVQPDRGVGPDPWMVLVETRKGGEEGVRMTREEGDVGPWPVLPGPLDRLERRGRRMIGPLGAPSMGGHRPLVRPTQCLSPDVVRPGCVDLG